MKICFFFALLLCIVSQAFAGDEVTIVDCKDKASIDLLSNYSTRLPFSSSGEEIVFRLPSNTVSATISEVKRETRIVEEFKSLLKAFNAFKSQASPKCANYRQKYQRSTITVRAFDEQHKNIFESQPLIAGPAEHLYWSADMPVTNIKQLSYDTNSSSVVEKEKPANFYLGVNWRYGDVYRDFATNQVLDNLAFKLMLKASNHPSESLGWGLGYSFDMVDVFVARIRTKEAVSSASVNLGKSDTTVWGVSFNISKALDWLKQ